MTPSIVQPQDDRKAGEVPKDTGSSDRASGSEGARKRSKGLRALAVSLPEVTKRAVGRRGFAEAGLIADWPSVVGDHLAKICQPRRLKFANRTTRTGGTLTLKVESGHALALQHLEPQLIERINAYLGFAAVAQLRLQQGPLPGPVENSGPPRRALSEAETAALEVRVGDIEDEDLRQALMNLGKAREEETQPETEFSGWKRI